MIPLRDTIRADNFPVVNSTIIGINVVIFILQLSQGVEGNRFVYIYGLVPARYTIPQIAAYFSAPQQAFSFVSFMFLHGGFWHLLGNMWSLYIFGDNVEDRLGPMRYLLFYLICGVASGVSHLLLNLNSNLPTIGASGAIAGVMGAYFILHPRAKILTLIPIFFYTLFFGNTGLFLSGHLVCSAISECRRQSGADKRCRMVGPYRRFCFRDHFFENPANDAASRNTY